MEVSSHALALHRVDGTRFAAAVFTNLGSDHLDLHGSAQAYFRAKSRLFTPELAAIGVTNVDDAHGRLLRDAGADPDRAVLGDRRHRRRGLGEPPRLHVARSSASPSASAARST